MITHTYIMYHATSPLPNCQRMYECVYINIYVWRLQPPLLTHHSYFSPSNKRAAHELMKPPHHHNRTFQYPTHRQNAPKNKERTITHHHTPTMHSKIIISVPCFNMCFAYNAIYSRHHPLHVPRSLRRRVWLVSASLIRPYPVTVKHFLF